MPTWLEEAWPHLTTGAAVTLTLLAARHAVLNKRDVRSASGWIGLIFFAPGVGALLYALLGVNRIVRRATRLRAGTHRDHGGGAGRISPEQAAAASPPEDAHLAELVRVVDRTTDRPLLGGNTVELLVDGDEAYPAMLEAIAGAKRSVALATYIFDDDAAGRRFVERLAAARARGVDVRVLVDDAGARYSRPPIDRALRREGVEVVRFMPVLVPWLLPYLNLRNHRKLMVVDGSVAFTGGMNIRGGCLLRESPSHPTADVHFRVTGPVVSQLLEVFDEDWRFAGGAPLEGDAWRVEASGSGSVLARALADGPDEDLDVMRWTFLGAIATARRSVRVVTPYFLPDEALVTALNVAALRGARVDVVLPGRGNLRFVEWAMRGEIWKVLGRGCRVWLTPPPFDHAKIFTVDGAWSLVGSPNWDPRSLRLNFELGLECHDRALAGRLDALVDDRIARAQELELDALRARPGWKKLRDGAARLLTPYL